MSEAQREQEMRTREEYGLRADRVWVEWVAQHGTNGGTMMMLPIPLADAEITDLRERVERGIRTGRAVGRAALRSAAGTWIEQEAGGLVHVLLAAPDDVERATVAAIVDGEHAVLDEVAHSTLLLEEIKAAITEETRAGSQFGAAVVDFGIDVTANAVHLRLRHDHDPLISECLRAAVTAGTLLIEFSELRWYAD